MKMTRERLAGQGLALAADIMGDPTDEPVIFLHGGGQTRASWGRALQAVADRGFYGLAIDLRGHGDSDWDANGHYELEDYGGDLRAVIARLGRKPFVVGASLGGMVGLMVAADRTEPIKGLVLVDIVPKYLESGAHRIMNFMNARSDGFASVDEAADDVAAFLPHRPRPTDTSGLLKNLRMRANGRYYWHWDKATLEGRHASDPGTIMTRLERAAGDLRAPTLLVRGGLSDVVDEAGALMFLSQAPHARLATVPGADHMVAGDQNDAFNQAVLDFLSAHRSR